MRKGPFVTVTPILLATVSLCWMAGASAHGSDLEAEYAQVRKIALKDPKVQEAFAKANDRLNQRILEIDPSLKPIVDRPANAPAPVMTPFVNRRGVPAPHAATHATPAAVTAGREHIVVSGETLDSIAHHYKVKVATLERVNRITDARKLRVGQKLLIPGAEPAASVSETAVAAPAPSAQPAATPASETQPKDGGNLWDKIKDGL